MRTLFLYGIEDARQASAYLDHHLTPSGEGQWTLCSDAGPFAWLRVDPVPELYGDESDNLIEHGPCIVADRSGALAHLEPDLIAFLKLAQSALGGTLRDDNDELL